MHVTAAIASQHCDPGHPQGPALSSELARLEVAVGAPGRAAAGRHTAAAEGAPGSLEVEPQEAAGSPRCWEAPLRSAVEPLVAVRARPL